MHALEPTRTRLLRCISSALLVALLPVAVLGTTGTAAAARMLEAWLCECGSAHADATATETGTEESCCSTPEVELPLAPREDRCDEGGMGCCCSTPSENDGIPPTRGLPEAPGGEHDTTELLRRELERSGATPLERGDGAALLSPPPQACRPPAADGDGGRASLPRTPMGPIERLALLCTSRT